MDSISWSEHVGNTGEYGAAFLFNRIGWSAQLIERHDRGEDLFLRVHEPTQHGLRDLGFLATAQVKTGPSHFDRPVRAGTDVTGWWYKESDKRRLHRWLDFPYPNFIVLFDDPSVSAYWQLVTTHEILYTGEGWKIFVPAAQRLDKDAIPRLLASVRRYYQEEILLERTAWVENAGQVESRSLWRQATCTPRRLAPHPNSGQNAELSPVSATALIATGRLSDYQRFAEAHESVPFLSAAAEQHDWGWRFVSALSSFHTGEVQEADFANLARTAPEAAWAAAQVAYACVLARHEKPREAANFLSAVRQEPNLPRQDWSWLTVHYGWNLFELGDAERARKVATEARQALQNYAEQTPELQAIKSAATSLLWRIDHGRGEIALPEVIRDADVRALWWRRHLLSIAGASTIEELFLQEMHSLVERRWRGEDEGHAAISALVLVAEFQGDQGGAYGGERLHARYHLSSIINGGEQPEGPIRDSLRSLRRSGDHDGLVRASVRIWESGPAVLLRDVFEWSVSPLRWTATNGLATLGFWRVAGDVAGSSSRERALSACMAALKNENPDFWSCATASWSHQYELLRAVGGLLIGAPKYFHQKVASWLSDGVSTGNLGPLDWMGINRIVNVLEWADVEEGTRANALTFAGDALGAESEQAVEVGLSILAQLSEAGYPEARRRLQQLAFERADERALIALVSFDVPVGECDLNVIREMLAARVQEMRNDAADGRHHRRGHQAAFLLVWFNLLDGSEPEWSIVRDVLADGCVDLGCKQDICRYIVKNASELPPEFRHWLLRDIHLVMAGADVGDFHGGTQNRNVWGEILGVVLGALDERRVFHAALNLARSANWRERLLAPELCWYGRDRLASEDRRAVLLTLSADSLVTVRSRAARFAALEFESSYLCRRIVYDSLSANGVLQPLGCLQGVLEAPSVERELVDEIERLRRHPSGVVRKSVDKVGKRWD